MMKQILLFIIFLTFVGCSNLKVSVDYDDSFDFSKQKTFMVMHKNKDGENTLVNDRIINSLEQNLELKNYKKISQEDVDLIFVFHLNIEDKSEVYTDYQMMGFGRYRYGGGMISTTSRYNYKEGTLIVDALNPKNKKIVWRASGVVELDKKRTPDERTEYVDEIVSKIIADFPVGVK